MAKLTGEAQYKQAAEDWVNWVVHTAPKSPNGMVYLDQWGPLRHAANAALIALQAADAGINAAENRQFAKNQIGYILGDTGRSFVVGIGVNPPLKPHHRAASCPDAPAGCDYWAFQSPAANPHILTGALVGGPDKSDSYKDARDDYVHNEVAVDYNAGFQSAVAGLLHLGS